MTRSMSTDTPRIDSHQQLDLFGVDRREPAAGSMDISARVRGVLKQAIKVCPLSRHHIAAGMSVALDRDISKAQIDAWTAPAHEAHRFPLEYAPAFCVATGDTGLIEMLADFCGGTFLPSQDLIDLELGRLAAAERRLKDKRRRLLKTLPPQQESAA